MSSKKLLQLAQELQEGAAEQEALLLELRQHPKRDRHAQSVLVAHLVDWSDDPLCRAVEAGIETITTQRALLRQTLYMLGPVGPNEAPALLN
jgi:hypothetical protein